MISVHLGVDISKDHLDVHWLPSGEARRFSNGKAGYLALLRWLATTPVARIV